MAHDERGPLTTTPPAAREADDMRRPLQGRAIRGGRLIAALVCLVGVFASSARDGSAIPPQSCVSRLLPVGGRRTQEKARTKAGKAIPGGGRIERWGSRCKSNGLIVPEVRAHEKPPQGRLDCMREVSSSLRAVIWTNAGALAQL